MRGRVLVAAAADDAELRLVALTDGAEQLVAQRLSHD